ncbi:dienelactone hydrolase [Gordonia pseudamarae]|uniref:Dienelactone hydrolase n=1 Tax=Gordonia pseudamarae TaxID=2831662 RepID=A0ABX6IHC3_9ACTN|nr:MULTISPECIES: dienelactone hydrolase family protein [Gordonia]MBD0022474.1 dienelactone hydrolase family protein [Gordonia sp. (in: high G+C Gram-positive bacteria)]QHN26340.1 dienelactone hydrolase [Gordonia pseudamarae]QHN35232.1 dienelactone hydrolase [Gordonia pseudamarae]
MTDPLADFATDTFCHDDMIHRYYRLGSGPAVVVIAEIPGITPAVVDFARRVVGAGYTVYLPSLFGIDGAGSTTHGPSVLLRSLAEVCVSREFTIFATGKSSPVVRWLRALSAKAHDDCGGPGVGAVGMCVTGGFALAMAVDDRMLAPVLSQPSLPLAITPGRRNNIDISAADLTVVKARCAAGLQILGARFDGDKLSPPDRFRFLREQLGDGFIGVELPDSSANPDGQGMPHSVLTDHLIDEPGQPTRDTLDQVLAFFHDKLGGAGRTTP